jgi:hypothetical protein
LHRLGQPHRRLRTWWRHARQDLPERAQAWRYGHAVDQQSPPTRERHPPAHLGSFIEEFLGGADTSMQQASALTSLNGKPLIVLTADQGITDDQWQADQNRNRPDPQSTCSPAVVSGVRHFSSLCEWAPRSFVQSGRVPLPQGIDLMRSPDVATPAGTLPALHAMNTARKAGRRAKRLRVADPTNSNSLRRESR